jgi:hypothetical protein
MLPIFGTARKVLENKKSKIISTAAFHCPQYITKPLIYSVLYSHFACETLSYHPHHPHHPPDPPAA